jgi:thiol-disulfide isomerase/thioredoxin
VLGIVLVVAAVVGINFVSSGGAQTRPRPPLPARALVGPKVGLDSLRGQATAVNFWASWCEPCRVEPGELRELAGSLPENTGLIGVNFTDDENGARSFTRCVRLRAALESAR